MGNYSDFDLNIKTTKNKNEVSPASTSNLCWAASSAVVSSVATGCTGQCVSTNCGTASGCSNSTCSCHC